MSRLHTIRNCLICCARRLGWECPSCRQFGYCHECRLHDKDEIMEIAEEEGRLLPPGHQECPRCKSNECEACGENEHGYCEACREHDDALLAECGYRNYALALLERWTSEVFGASESRVFVLARHPADVEDRLDHWWHRQQHSQALPVTILARACRPGGSLSGRLTALFRTPDTQP